MSASTEIKQETVETSAIPPFTIEVDHPRNCDILLQCIVNCRLRSAFNGMKPAKDRNGRAQVPIDQALTFASAPSIPGMRLYVNPGRCFYRIIDPLYENRDICEQIEQWQKAYQPVTAHQKVGGHKPQEGKLDLHRMKSLLKELREFFDDGQIKVVDGDMPSREDIGRAPGRFLLNPGARVQNTQPVYLDEFADGVTNLSRSGG